MDLYGRADLAHAPARVFEAVADLATYDEWLGIVAGVTPAPADAQDAGPAWYVELGARLGPLRRTKRLRMVRTVHEADSRARFERHEHDDRAHSPWILTATVEPAGAEETHLRMDLHYGGAGWLPGLDLVLRQEIRRAGGRLDRYLERA